MALPHQVGLSITYDGTATKASDSAASGSAGSSSTAGGGTHTVVPGDTLWDLARKNYGSGAKYTIIYNANKEIIEATAKARGRASSDNGHWIWPGTVLTIPEIETTVVKTSLVTVGTATPQLGEKIAKQANAFSYTDVASGQSDSVSITIHDISKEWLGSLKPKRGASLGAALVLTNWNEEEKTDTFDCGTFVLDDISFSGRPLSCVLGGVSVPAMDDFKALPRTKTWEKTTIKEIASEIASRAGVSLFYDANTIQIAEKEQDDQTDSAFLYSLCEKYGLAMKVYNHKIVIFDIVAYEAMAAILDLNETDMLSWSYNETIEGTYTGVTLSYTDPDSDKTIDVTRGSAGRMYYMNAQATSQYDAELQAAAKVNAANRAIETMEVTIRANINLVASHCINIKGLESADGKYYVDKVKHSIGSGYKMQLTLHKVQAPIMVTASAAPASGFGSYEVAPGDTLWGISKRFYGSGAKYTIIYNANKEIIESTARAHGKSSSSNGHWIWPKTVLTIPEV